MTYIIGVSVPLREYRCQSCEKNTENLELKAEDKLLSCPSCGSDNLERVISAHGGYDMASGPSSVRPRQAGSFKVKK